LKHVIAAGAVAYNARYAPLPPGVDRRFEIPIRTAIPQDQLLLQVAVPALLLAALGAWRLRRYAIV
jgi:hypothetical protein